MKLLMRVCPMQNKSVRIGITGVPALESFIEGLGKHFNRISEKKQPFWPSTRAAMISHSILGDKTRMEELVVIKRLYPPSV
jgi:putative protein kinase ArgK-like GTPase of G3E family